MDNTKNSQISLLDAVKSEVSERKILSIICGGADVNETDSEGKCPIHYVYQYSDDITRLLIKFGANVNQEDNKGNRAIHYVSKNYCCR